MRFQLLIVLLKHNSAPTMIHQNPAQIFKAQRRGLSETPNHRLHATFNFEDFSDPSRHPFGILSALNDETLEAKQHIERILPANTVVMIVPLAGAAECQFTGGEVQVIVPGEAFTYYTSQNSMLSVRNPYDESLINFLYIAFSETIVSDTLLPERYLIAQADLSEKNTFHKLFDAILNSLSVRIGIFGGREEAYYSPTNIGNGVFAFVIAGAFEIQGRLLEERDGMALWNTGEIDVEALSENAILLLIEAPLNGMNPN